MKNKDMPAMPLAVAVDASGDIASSYDFEGGAGLTKREYFASMAMQGILTNAALVSAFCNENGVTKSVKMTVSETAVIYADALLEALEES